MKKIMLFGMMLFVINAFGQNTQEEINEQVWKPFLKNFNERNTEGFMAVHSKDAIRSPRDSKMIWNWNEYRDQQKRGDQQEKSTQSNRQLELHFTERIANKDLAIEVGVYKTTYIQKDGIAKSFYGRFHVVLKKENGVWKILVDTDSSENNTISEKEFLAAAPME